MLKEEVRKLYDLCARSEGPISREALAPVFDALALEPAPQPYIPPRACLTEQEMAERLQIGHSTLRNARTDGKLVEGVHYVLVLGSIVRYDPDYHYERLMKIAPVAEAAQRAQARLKAA